MINKLIQLLFTGKPKQPAKDIWGLVGKTISFDMNRVQGPESKGWHKCTRISNCGYYTFMNADYRGFVVHQNSVCPYYQIEENPEHDCNLPHGKSNKWWDKQI